MRLIEIEPKCIYAIKYPDEEFDEYNRIFEHHQDFDKVLCFFEAYHTDISQYLINELQISPKETEAYAKLVVEETIDLEEYFEDLIDNTLNGATPDLKGHFKILEGFESEAIPAVKSYGLNKPSMLRVYAIEVDRTSLVIFYSGIKIRHSISECPILKDNVLQRARRVISFLTERGATDIEGLIDLVKTGGR